ncbi:SGNH/GDSL hydrolase family protein [Pseudobdellovibrio exovorus]|uniref:Uncharacterized protein n=1 Tax=Pseudobdellovibrio exovorus JSS TaxID=1184267 RepID=M4VEU6_9BACT|nr:SGNH/GDSL hydrolase family protein [Pseudobdellovibrio exovorus]AGH96556.1 hypothetical protein A11Q_2340 [Pseudobdellovibrio exovorus JSS]
MAAFRKILIINTLGILSILIAGEIFLRHNPKEPVTLNVDNPATFQPILTPSELLEKYGIDVNFQIDPERKAIDEKILSLTHPTIDLSYSPDIGKLFTSSTLPASAKITKKFMPPNENYFVYDVEYKLDTYKRRVTEHQDKKTTTTKFFLALGDSYTFGEGVTTGFDYPSQLAKILPNNWMVYNFGHPGYGINDLLYKIETEPHALAGVKEASGIVVWYFIPAHLERFFCPLSCYNEDFGRYILHKPYYTSEQGKLIYHGRFTDRLTLWHKLLSYLNRSHLFQYLYKMFPVDYSEEELDTFADAFVQLKENLSEQKQIEKFYFISTFNFKNKDELFQRLRNKEIDVVDLTNIPFYAIPHNTLPFDNHPTANFYHALSKVIKVDLIDTLKPK